MKRSRQLALVALIVGVAVPPTATAGGPTREVIDWSGDSVHAFCGFPVRTLTEGRVAVITFTDELGNVTKSIEPIAGRFQASATNLDTGTTLELHISGPGIFEVPPDGGTSFTTLGPWTVIRNPITLEFGYFLLQGQRTLVVDAEGDRTFTFHGRIVDLCAELKEA